MRSFPRLIVYVLVAAGAIVSVFPFYWSLLKMLTPEGDIFTYPPEFFIANPVLTNLKNLIRHIPFVRNIINTFFVAAASSLSSIFLCSLGGFAFSKYDFPFKKGLFMFMLATAALPFSVQLVPLFIIMTKLRWIDTYYALIIPWMANAFGIFWMTQYIRSLPDDLIDAARIDGYGEFRIFIRIILPNIKPALFSLGIIMFLSSYNDFLWPLVVLNDLRMYTAPLALAMLKVAGMAKPLWGELMAGSSLVTIPMVIVFIVFQKNIVAGIMKGAVKE